MCVWSDRQSTEGGAFYCLTPYPFLVSVYHPTSTLHDNEDMVDSGHYTCTRVLSQSNNYPKKEQPHSSYQPFPTVFNVLLFGSLHLALSHNGIGNYWNFSHERKGEIGSECTFTSFKEFWLAQSG